jgi:hypothetical protein
MKRPKVRIWKREGWGDSGKRKPQFFLTDKEKRDGESFVIQRWLNLADRLFEGDESDATQSAA